MTAQPSIAQPTLPARLYGDPAAYAREQAAIFARTWQFVGPESALAAPGDYLCEEIGGAEVVVVRDGEGGLRAHFNVCRHRAGPLVSEAQGNCGKELVCRYHGWRYALDGRLRSAVDFGRADGFDPRDFGLHPVRVETWRGMVFVNRDMGAAPLADVVAPLEAIWRERGLKTAPFALRRHHDLACDWKVYVENYLEGYHIPAIHPSLNAGIEASLYSVRVDGDLVIQEAPLKASADTGSPRGLWGWLWPNLGVNVYPGGLLMERMHPVGQGRMRIDYFYFHDPDGGADLDDTVAVSTCITAEDIEITEAVQRNLSSGVYDRGVLSPRHEAAVAWFQARIAYAHAGDF